MPAVLTLDAADRTPVYAQLERGILAAIATGRLKVGEQLPTVRQLAVDLRINANTVAKVYVQLERSGVLETRRGVGTFVTAMVERPAAATARHVELRRLIERFLADLSAHGFSAEHAIAELEARRHKGA